MIRTQEEWWEWCMEKGTYGAQVFDILQDWKEHNKYFKKEIAGLRKELEEIKASVNIKVV